MPYQYNVWAGRAAEDEAHQSFLTALNTEDLLIANGDIERRTECRPYEVNEEPLQYVRFNSLFDFLLQEFINTFMFRPPADDLKPPAGGFNRESVADIIGPITNLSELENITDQANLFDPFTYVEAYITNLGKFYWEKLESDEDSLNLSEEARPVITNLDELENIWETGLCP